MRGKTIMVIDDEEPIRDIYKDMLEYEKYSVIPCENGRDALIKYKTMWHVIDLVITDIMMPVMNGYEFFIKAKEINPNIKLIVISGYPGEFGKMLIEEGALEFIEKPQAMNKLIKTIKKHI